MTEETDDEMLTRLRDRGLAMAIREECRTHAKRSNHASYVTMLREASHVLGLPGHPSWQDCLARMRQLVGEP